MDKSCTVYSSYTDHSSDIFSLKKKKQKYCYVIQFELLPVIKHRPHTIPVKECQIEAGLIFVCLQAFVITSYNYRSQNL